MKEQYLIAVFRESDLRRLRIILACYESPFTLPGEAACRIADEREHERLRREIERVLG